MSSDYFPVRGFNLERRQYGDVFWRSLFYFNVYRLTTALVLLAAALTLGGNFPFGSNSRHTYLYTDLGYVLFSALAFAAILPRRPYFTVQLTVHICGDILFLTALMYASGGIFMIDMQGTRDFATVSKRSRTPGTRYCGSCMHSPTRS